jgi:hypothetical protein
MRRLLAASLAHWAAAPLAAQVARPAIGDRVLLETRAGTRVVGTVAALGADTIHLRGTWAGVTMALPVTAVAGFQTSLGYDRWRGARVGALTGGIVGAAVVALALHADATTDAALSIPSTVIAAPAAAGLVLLGAGIGAVAMPERWTGQVPLQVGALLRGPGHSRLGVRLAARF